MPQLPPRTRPRIDSARDRLRADAPQGIFIVNPVGQRSNIHAIARANQYDDSSRLAGLKCHPSIAAVYRFERAVIDQSANDSGAGIGLICDLDVSSLHACRSDVDKSLSRLSRWSLGGLGAEFRLHMLNDEFIEERSLKLGPMGSSRVSSARHFRRIREW